MQLVALLSAVAQCVVLLVVAGSAVWIPWMEDRSIGAQSVPP